MRSFRSFEWKQWNAKWSSDARMDFLKKKFDQITGEASDVVKRVELPNADIAEALKEALEVATKAAVDLVSSAGGFLKDPTIRVPLPPQLQLLADALCRIPGGRAQVEEFEKTLNLAAEAAAKEAHSIFAPLIKALTMEKAIDILNGESNAATAFFEAGTRAPLHDRFLPVVAARMRDVGLVDVYDKIIVAFSKLPIFEKPSVDLSEFVTTAALDGLFKKLAVKEKEIRDVPAARITPMIAKVFGSK